MMKEDAAMCGGSSPQSCSDELVPVNSLQWSQHSSLADDDLDNSFHRKFQEAESKLHNVYNDCSLACSFRRICNVEPKREQSSIFASYVDYSSAACSLSKSNSKESLLVKKILIDYALSHIETNWLGKKALYLNNLKLSEEDIPITEIENLKHSLEKLSLSGNRIESIPQPLVESLSSLKTLDLSRCLIRSLPSNWNLPKLVHLNLSHNRLVDFPPESMFEGLPNLQELNLYNNQISEIRLPENILCLSKLKHLDLGDNGLTCIPKKITLLPSLKSLGLCLNHLTEVPLELCDGSIRFVNVSKPTASKSHASASERSLLAMMRCWKGVIDRPEENGFCIRKRAVQASVSFSPKLSKKIARGLVIANSDDDTVREEEDPVSKAFHEKYQQTPPCSSLLLRE